MASPPAFDALLAAAKWRAALERAAFRVLDTPVALTRGEGRR